MASPGFYSAHADFGGVIRLEGVIASGLASGKRSPIELVWRVTDGPAVAPLYLSEFVHLVDGTGRVLSANADLWGIHEPLQTGDLVISPFDLNIDPSALTGGYWLETGFYQSFSQQPLTASADGKQASVRLGPFRVAGDRQALDAGQPLAVFGEEEVRLRQVRWEGREVTLDWEALKPPAASYTVFVHAVDGSGTVMGQRDGVPQGGRYPTDMWRAGDVVHDTYDVGVEARAGLRLEIGMYTQPNVHRVAVRAPGAGVQDHLLVDAPG
jgi:hypothetical protein